MSSLVARAQLVGAVAAQYCEDVDKEGRFPSEAVRAMKEARLLSAFIPRAFGGEGADLSEIAEVVSIISQACASAGMTYAMHQIKVSSVISHGDKAEWHQDFMRRISRDQLLVASATTEGGVGGNLRNSICAVERDGDRFTLAKDGCVISYGRDADAILITARSRPDAPASDQVMAVLTKDQYKLELTGVWDAMGMRGTCSDNFKFSAEGDVAQVLPNDFGEIAAKSMLAICHILWSAVWYGIASSAVSRAQSFVRAEARRNPGQTPPGALRVAEAANMLQLMRSNTIAGLSRFADAKLDEDDLGSVGFIVAMNNIKIGASRMVVDIINHALLITGINGYRNNTPYSVGRHMRDALSAQIMISNDRIFGNVANLLLMHRLDPSLAA
ncbi:MAG TPA: acyl-CoA dehydrogenase family protein [Rhodoblastus sp.]|nr:acyl-CoA dehydrogenase family protein [Rhodoblastus sp.]